jgi:hypothetical protein
MWQYYRFDFESSTGVTGKPPVRSWEFDFVKLAWKSRTKDAIVDMSDIEESSFYYQVDTSSSDNNASTTGPNGTTSTDINFAGIPVPYLASNTTGAGSLGGRQDSGSTGYYYEDTGIPDGIIKSVAVTPTFPAFKLRYDNNTTKIGLCTVFISFNTKP